MTPLFNQPDFLDRKFSYFLWARTNMKIKNPLFLIKCENLLYFFSLHLCRCGDKKWTRFYSLCNYSFNPRPSRFYTDFDIYVGDNYVNSFEDLDSHKADGNHFHRVEIAKDSVETKLPEPYNQCKESLTNENYHQSNCIDTCISKEIKNKYNCTFVQSLFAIPGLKHCNYEGKRLYKEFLSVCQKECSESCYSERFTAEIWSSELSSELSGQTWFRFSFGDLSSLTITQVPKIDGFTFLNNIGGGLGLFMGITFPTLIEFIEFTAEILWTAFLD